MPPKTSGKAAAKSGKASKAVVNGDKKKKGKRKESYAIYIYKVFVVTIDCMYQLIFVGAEASSSRYWCVFQGHEHHELIRKRPL